MSNVATYHYPPPNSTPDRISLPSAAFEPLVYCLAHSVEFQRSMHTPNTDGHSSNSGTISSGSATNTSDDFVVEKSTVLGDFSYARLYQHHGSLDRCLPDVVETFKAMVASKNGSNRMTTQKGVGGGATKDLKNKSFSDPTTYLTSSIVVDHILLPVTLRLRMNRVQQKRLYLGLYQNTIRQPFDEWNFYLTMHVLNDEGIRRDATADCRKDINVNPSSHSQGSSPPPVVNLSNLKSSEMFVSLTQLNPSSSVVVVSPFECKTQMNSVLQFVEAKCFEALHNGDAERLGNREWGIEYVLEII